MHAGTHAAWACGRPAEEGCNQVPTRQGAWHMRHSEKAATECRKPVSGRQHVLTAAALLELPSGGERQAAAAAGVHAAAAAAAVRRGQKGHTGTVLLRGSVVARSSYHQSRLLFKFTAPEGWPKLLSSRERGKEPRETALRRSMHRSRAHCGVVNLALSSNPIPSISCCISGPPRRVS
jgi:hypothetical protein